MTKKIGSDLVLLGGRGASPKLVRQDPRFAPLYERFGPAKVEAGRDPFASIVEALCHQQLSLAAGRTVYGRVEKACRGRVTAARLLKLGPEELRACGLSRSKCSYCLDLSVKALKGELVLSELELLDDEDVVAALTEVKGIGPWTAQMLLLFTFHRPDVLPTEDLGILDGAKRVLGLRGRPSPLRLEKLAEPWRPYRSVASWYLWRERDRQLSAAGKR